MLTTPNTPTIATLTHSGIEHHVLPAGELATLIAEFGIGRFESEVAEIAAVAVDHGAPTNLSRLVLDRSSPAIVRERAFGMMAAHLPTLR
jgi:hypothetical protein